MEDLDGSFCYLVADGDALGYASDPFGLKPLIIVETRDYVAIANEGLAFRAALEAGPPGRERTNHPAILVLPRLGASRAA